MAQHRRERIWLTGGTGFIGSRLHAALAAAGYPIRSLVRPESSRKPNALAHFNPVYGAIDDPELIRTALADVQAVIYAAGTVRGRQPEDFTLANERGVKALVAALAQMADPPPVLLLSSLAATSPQLSWYAASKAAGEQALINSKLASWTILRPPAVYGPGDVEMLPLLSLIRKGIVLMPGGATQRISLIHVDDLVSAVLAWLQAREHCQRQCFAIDDGGPHRDTVGYSWRDIGSLVCAKPCRYITLPERLLAMVGCANLGFARLLRYAPMLTPGKARELQKQDWLCDNHEFSRRTGWVPQIGLREGSQQLFADCKAKTR